MGAPSIKQDIFKMHQSALRRLKRRGRVWNCALLQNPDGKVLGVAIDRNAIGRLYERLTAEGIDWGMAECKDFEVTI